MREGWPSVTASFVAFARAAASAAPMTSSPLADPVARRLFPWPGGRLGQVVARATSAGLVDHIALRTAAIDELLGAGPRPLPQLVLLGAGLDARAHRLGSLAETRVFEVDHPASQRLKRRLTRGLPVRAHSVEYVTADFAKDDIAARLAAAGHDRTRPTAWIVEGVAVYLPASLTAHVLSVVDARSAAGSMLALTYIHASRAAVARRVGGVMLRALGEPLGAEFSREEIAALVGAAHLSVESDTNDVDWSARFGASSRLASFFLDERLLVARRPLAE